MQPNPTSDGSSNSTAPTAPTVASDPPATKTGRLLTFLSGPVIPFPFIANFSVPTIESNPPAPQPATSSSPQKEEPSTLETSSTSPAPPKPSEPQLQQTTGSGATQNADSSVQVPKSADNTPTTVKTDKNGMSATSGPLDDQIVHEFSDLGQEHTNVEVPREEAAVAGKAEVTAAKPVNVDAVNM